MNYRTLITLFLFLLPLVTVVTNGEKGIAFYKKPPDIDPDLSAAKFTVEWTANELDIKNWALRNLSVECRPSSQPTNISVSIKCAREHFSFNGQPIHPKIIHELSTWLSDGGDQIVSFNLNDSQNSNRFCCKGDIKVKNWGDRFVVYFRKSAEEFGYEYIGITKSGIHVIRTYYRGGGTGIFVDIMLANIKLDYGTFFDEENSVIYASRPRLLIKKLGEIALGDRWYGKLRVDGDNLFIGRDTGKFAGTKYGGPYSEKPQDRIGSLKSIFPPNKNRS